MIDAPPPPRPGLLDHLRLAAHESDPAWTLEFLHDRFGPIVDFGYRIPMRMVCAFGPEANQHILADNVDNFTWREAFQLNDTTSSATAWLVHALGTHPDVLADLRAQVRDTVGDRAPTIDDLRAMPLVDGVVRETLRLWPPGTISGRRAVSDFELFGHRVPGGSMVLYSPYITHRLPDVWGDPLVFRPERWADGEPVPYSFVPFGGGYRKCIGFALATLELQVLAVRLAQRVTWSLDRPVTTGTGMATYAPKGGVPITVGVA